MKEFKKHFEQCADNESDFSKAKLLRKSFMIFNKKDRIAESQELHNLCQYLNTFNIKYWIDFGTLLGAFRKNKLIEFDNDIDISLVLYGKTTLYEIAETLSPFYYIEHYEPYYLCIYPKNNKNFGFAHIDLYVFEELEEQKLMKCKISGWENLIYRTYFFDNMSEINIENYKFPAPRHTGEYLKLIYGDDYLKEKKNSHSKPTVINPERVKNEKVTVYLTGVFDLFHVGHVNIFKNSKKYFDKLIVGVHNDDDVSKYKDKPIIEYNDRLEIIRSCKYVDQIIENAPLYITDDYLDNIGARYLIFGEENKPHIKNQYIVSYDRIHTFKRTSHTSSSIIKNKLNTL